MNESGSQSHAARELQSQLSFQDFAFLVVRHRNYYLAGLLLIMATTFCVVRFGLTKFYLSEALIFVGNRFTPESLRPGLAEAQIVEGSRNDMYLAIVQGQLAEEFLRSSRVLLAVAERMHEPSTTDTARSEAPIDVYKLLGIKDSDSNVRRAEYVKMMRDDLIHVTQLQNSGLLDYGVELPEKRAAQRFAELSLLELESAMNEVNWGYFDKAVQVYEDQMKNEMQRRDQMAAELTEFNRRHDIDQIPMIQERRRAMEEKLSVQAKTIAELNRRIESLRTATSLDAKRAALPFQVINEPRLPLKKSRPKTILTTLTVGLAYSFVFLCGLLVTGLLGVGRRLPEPRL